MLTYMLSGRSLCGRPTAFETPRHLSLFYSPPLKKAAHSFPGRFLYAKYQHIPQEYFMESVLAPHDGIIIARPEIRTAFVMTFQIPRRDVLFPQHGAGKFIIFFVVLAVHTCFTAILHALLPPSHDARKRAGLRQPFCFYSSVDDDAPPIKSLSDGAAASSPRMSTMVRSSCPSG